CAVACVIAFSLHCESLLLCVFCSVSSLSFFFLCYVAHRYLHSFPTRRSSDLLFLAIIQTFFLISWFSLLLLQLLRHLFYRHLKLHRQRYILIVSRVMRVMVVFFIACRWLHLSTPLISLFLLVLMFLWSQTLNVVPFCVTLL